MPETSLIQTLSLILICEIYVGFFTLYEINFQSVRSTLISFIKKINIKDSVINISL